MVTTKPIFHRGDTTSGREENTMAAFKAAAGRGRGFEFDIHASKDSKFVVIHDPTWDRTTTGKGRVNATDWADVVDIRTKGGATIPSLARVIPLTSEGAAPVLIDWKAADDTDAWTDDMLVRANDIIVENGAQNRHFAFTDDTVLIERLHTLAPDMRISFRPAEVDTPYSVASVQNLGCQAVQPNWRSLTKNKVKNFQDAGLKVISQDRDINGPSDLTAVRNLGVDYVLIDAGKWDRWS